MERDCKSLLRKFCLESSIMGLKYFYLYPDPLSRCFWAVSLLVTLFISITLTLYLYNRFLDMPTRIAIENQYAPLQNVSFPAITICSPNQVTLDTVDHFKRTLVDGNMTTDLKKILPMLLGFYEIINANRTKVLNEFNNLITLNRYNVLEVMGLLPQRCEDFLRFCYLKGELYPNCKGLFMPILTKHGMCCIFNSVYQFKHMRNIKVPDFVPHVVSKGGFGEGLTVIADYDPETALSGTLLVAGAVRSMFTEPHEFPADDESNLVYPKTESFHFIHATHTYCSEDVAALPYWSRQCYFEHEESLPHFGNYRNSDCDHLCAMRAVERVCHCSMPYAPYVRLLQACNVTSIACIVEAKVKMNKLSSAESCLCLRDCVSTRYQVDVSIGNLDASASAVGNPYSGFTFNESSLVLHYFFRNSVHAKQKQETVMSLITISSNLGGVFGLCLGCSLMSVFEIIFYIYCAVKNKILNQKARKNKVHFMH